MNCVAMPLAENPPVLGSGACASGAALVHPKTRHAESLTVTLATLTLLAILTGPSQAMAATQVLTNQERGNAQVEYSRQIRNQSVTRTTPRMGRYRAANGQVFALGQAGNQLLLRFDRSNETWVLRPTSAPRGDTLYRNDAGEQFLRVNASGGITLYSRRSPGGSPVSAEDGPVPNLEPQALGPVNLLNVIMRRSLLISDTMGRLVQINLDGDQSEALCVEALMVSTDTVVRIARSPSARPFLDGLRVITIIEGNRSAVTYQRGELRIVVDPSRGVAGRPSSARIIRAIIPED